MDDSEDEAPVGFEAVKLYNVEFNVHTFPGC